MNITIIGNLLQILLIIIALTIVLSSDNIKMVIFFSAFSLITSGLYYFNKAPDVALAEVAIGSAIMPLILIISISKQRVFMVVNYADDDFLSSEEGKEGRGYEILASFSEYYKLKLEIHPKEDGEPQGLFTNRSVDLLVEKCPSTNKYLLKGKKSSILMNKLEQMTIDKWDIEVLKIKEGETDD
ncbi:MAG: DUF4040 domain-containing protein [Clostridia bacterium]|nr:DUF4040 domain-containing protein [Clostridia bacterium]